MRTHMYTRMCVPIDADTSRIVYYHTTRPGSLLGRIYERVQFLLWHNWVMNIQFSNQDATCSWATGPVPHGCLDRGICHEIY